MMPAEDVSAGLPWQKYHLFVNVLFSNFPSITKFLDSAAKLVWSGYSKLEFYI